MLWELFMMFIKVGFVSFGGGYAIIPIIQYETVSSELMTAGQFQEAVAIAGMAPGSIATNTATLIGYQSAGVGGAIVSTLGIVLPSLLIVILLSIFFYRLQHNKWMKSSFYGLRAITTGLVAYAAIHFLYPNNGGSVSWELAGTLAICGICLFLLFKFKLHPLLVIVAAGVAGIVLY
jgi:chromate transporter